MYLKFYNLREFPFNITPDPKFLYFASQHKEAFDYLMYGITQRKGFIELTGEVGSGKTTTCRAILSKLPASVETALILNPSLTETQLLRAILSDLGLNAGHRDRLTCIEVLNEFLLEKNAEGKNVALFIDEAQDLSPKVMEQIRLLSNLETDQHKLIQIILCGQPELKERLAREDLRQLRQRITVRYHIKPLTLENTKNYIEHRLYVAGNRRKESLFSDEAVEKVFDHSKGSPRVINAVCDNALLAGYASAASVIDKEHVIKAIKHIEG